MMTQQEILNEVLTLPISEQLEIADKIQGNISLENGTNGSNQIEDERELTIEERIAITMNLSGCLRPEGSYIPMTKEEDREVIEEYLVEKYS